MVDWQPIGQHTIGHLDCPACAETKDSIMYSGRFADSLFPEAALQWLDSRRGRIAPRTLRECRDYAATLGKFFKAMRLGDIHIGNFVAYQQARQAEIRRSPQHAAAQAKVGRDLAAPQASDGASRINHELSMLRSMLRFAGCWTGQLANFYEPLPTPKQGPGIALTDEEERHLFKVAASRPQWLVACHCAALTRNTTAGPGEVLHLQLGDVDLKGRTIAIRFTAEYGKNPFRERTLPLNSDALAAAAWLLARAQRLGAAQREDFLVPARGRHRGDRWDASRPMKSYRKAWEALRAVAGREFPRLLTVRRYDLRHTACTRLLENGAISEATIERIMGHRLGSRTKQRYAHIRDASLRLAAEALQAHATGGRPAAITADDCTIAGIPGPPRRACRAARFSWRARDGKAGTA